MKTKNVVISLIFPVLTLIANLWTLLFGFNMKIVFIVLFAAFIFGGIPLMMTLCGVDTSEYVIEKFIFIIVHTILWTAIGFWLIRYFDNVVLFVCIYTVVFLALSAVYFGIRTRNVHQTAVLTLSNPAIVFQMLTVLTIIALSFDSIQIPG